jgi:hypothetical protein
VKQGKAYPFIYGSSPPLIAADGVGGCLIVMVEMFVLVGLWY